MRFGSGNYDDGGGDAFLNEPMFPRHARPCAAHEARSAAGPRAVLLRCPLDPWKPCPRRRSGLA
jgi:hypothetical protein